MMSLEKDLEESQFGCGCCSLASTQGESRPGFGAETQPQDVVGLKHKRDWDTIWPATELKTTLSAHIPGPRTAGSSARHNSAAAVRP